MQTRKIYYALTLLIVTQTFVAQATLGDFLRRYGYSLGFVACASTAGVSGWCAYDNNNKETDLLYSTLGADKVSKIYEEVEDLNNPVIQKEVKTTTYGGRNTKTSYTNEKFNINWISYYRKEVKDKNACARLISLHKKVQLWSGICGLSVIGCIATAKKAFNEITQ